MSRFVEVLEKIIGKKVEIHNTSLFWKVVNRGVIKYTTGKRRPYLSTNDLGQDLKPRANYLKERKPRKKKENEGAIASPSIYDIWKI